MQTHRQALTKGGQDAATAAGRRACLAHVATMTTTKAVTLAVTTVTLGLQLPPLLVVAGLGVDAVSHYWADRRSTLAALAALLGKSDYYRLGSPRPGREDNPSAATGASTWTRPSTSPSSGLPP